MPALVYEIFKIMRIKANPKRAIIAARKAIERDAEDRARVGAVVLSWRTPAQ